MAGARPVHCALPRAYRPNASTRIPCLAHQASCKCHVHHHGQPCPLIDVPQGNQGRGIRSAGQDSDTSGTSPALVDVLPTVLVEQGETATPHHKQLQNNVEATYGLSSNATVLKEISELMKAQGKSPNNLEEDSVPTLLEYPENRPRSPGVRPQPMKLPERTLVEEFTHNFWVFLHPVFPILHKPSFTARSSSLLFATDNNVHDPVFRATLSIVLAMGSQRTERLPITQRECLADELYRQSCRLVSVDFPDESSVRVVQLLLLRGVYLHYYSIHADRCWNTIGLALRVAQGLGLGYEDAGSKGTNQLTREMKR
jgi:hypothetical protein